MFVLIHSPLVGPLTWSLVADELQRKGIEVVVPVLREVEEPDTPYWLQHVRAVARTLMRTPRNRRLILVGHSGAGMLLPATRQVVGRPVAAYIFADAGIPEDGKSRLDLFGSPTAAEQFRQTASNGLLPTWHDADLEAVIPDADLRRRFVTELRPLPLAAYEEPIPVFDGWPDAPCGYVRFGANPAYAAPAERARSAGWAYADFTGDHFHMLVDPVAVTNALLDLVARLGISVRHVGKP